MKPRKRVQQHQYGRLYLRNNDHRDVIYNDNYHNMLFAEQIPKPGDSQDLQTGLLWKKYPKMEVIQDYNYSDYGYYGADWGCMDIERQFSYVYNAGTNPGYLIQLKDYVVRYVTANGWRWISKDGIEWKQIGTSNSVSFDGKCGDNGYAWLYYESNRTYIRWGIETVNEDEEGEITFDYHVYELDVGMIVSGAKYICDTRDGMLVIVMHYNPQLTTNKYHYMIYEIVGYNATLLHTFDTPLGETDHVKGCRKGSFYAFTTSTFDNQAWKIIDKIYSSNNKVDWDAAELGRYDVLGSERSSYIEICERNNFFYIYSVTPNASPYLKAWKSDTGSYWIELNLPDYIDLPVLSGRSGGGIHESPYTGDTLRIALNPANTPSSEITTVPIANFLTAAGGNAPRTRFNRDFGNVMFSDGEIDTTTEFLGLYYRNTGQSYSKVYAFIDNMTFTNVSEYSKSFAWVSNQVGGYADTLIEGDYCLGGGNTVQNI